jgi:membrane fusion protein, multidrug efflux system
MAKTPIFIITAFILVSIIACKEDKNANLSKAAIKTPIRATVISSKPIELLVKSTGTLLANEEVELTAEAAGKIIKINFDEGQKVNKGDEILRLNALQHEAKKRSLLSDLELQQQRLERREKLLKKEAVSSEEVDEIKALINSIQSEIDAIQAQLDLSVIYAPFSGVIGVRTVSEGAFISPGNTVATLVDFDRLKLEFSLPEKYSSSITKDVSVKFKVNGSDSVYVAQIYTIEPKISPSTRTFKVRCMVENDEKQLLPGSFANVEIILEKIPDALMIPNESIVQEMEGKQVFVYSEGKVEVRKIQTGIRFSDSSQVIEGLQVKDTLVTSGLLNIRPGMEVEIINPL